MLNVVELHHHPHHLHHLQVFGGGGPPPVTPTQLCHLPCTSTQFGGTDGGGNGNGAVQQQQQQQQRSTRGASKQRRDQINVEIQKLRDLLPLSDLIKDRLFQLQVMSLGCIFIRKHRYQQTALPAVLPSLPMPRGIDICKALRGFMIMMTRSGKILHVSDNASEYLGHSVEEIMCQGDSIYDLVDVRDHAAVQAELASGPPTAANFPDERVFICRLNLARTAKRQLQYHKFVLLQGRYLQPAEVYQQIAAQTSQPEADQSVFSTYCQPLLNPENADSMATGNTNIFVTQHFLDMRFKEVDSMSSYHFGYSKEKLKGMSWYSMLHPSHVPELAYKHRLLCQEKEGSVLALIRLQSCSGEWIWFHTVFSIRPNSNNNEMNQDGKRVRHVIHCVYQRLSDLEAATLQANSWIYSMRHTYPTGFSANQDVEETPSTTEMTPPPQQETKPVGRVVKKEFPCVGIDYNQIQVEIPVRHCPIIPTQIPVFTPESSSPESSASLHNTSHVSFGNTILDEILPPSSSDVLPELKDEVDEILRQVEHEPRTPVLHHNHQHRHSFDASELYKYLGPALYPPHPNSYVYQTNPQQQCLDYNNYNRKRSWAV